jgi:hypothetical protein
LTEAQITAVKAIMAVQLETLSEEQKAEEKSYKFEKYEKISGTETTETGTVTATYKKNGDGEEKTETQSLSFIRVEDKWYVVLPNFGI